jgi:ATP adenylyltransferase
MEFIRSPKEEACFLCRIVREGPEKGEENLVIHRGRFGLLLMNRYPYTSGHLLAAPFRHIGALDALTEEEMKELMALTCLGQRLLERVMHPQGFNMGINQGSAAGAGLKDHLHMHVVPRWEGDANFMPVIGHVRVVPQALEETAGALRKALAEIQKGE